MCRILGLAQDAANEMGVCYGVFQEEVRSVTEGLSGEFFQRAIGEGAVTGISEGLFLEEGSIFRVKLGLLGGWRVIESFDTLLGDEMAPVF